MARENRFGLFHHSWLPLTGMALSLALLTVVLALLDDHSRPSRWETVHDLRLRTLSVQSSPGAMPEPLWPELHRQLAEGVSEPIRLAGYLRVPVMIQLEGTLTRVHALFVDPRWFEAVGLELGAPASERRNGLAPGTALVGPALAQRIAGSNSVSGMALAVSQGSTTLIGSLPSGLLESFGSPAVGLVLPVSDLGPILGGAASRSPDLSLSLWGLASAPASMAMEQLEAGLAAAHARLGAAEGESKDARLNLSDGVTQEPLAHRLRGEQMAQVRLAGFLGYSFSLVTLVLWTLAKLNAARAALAVRVVLGARGVDLLKHAASAFAYPVLAAALLGSVLGGLGYIFAAGGLDASAAARIASLLQAGSVAVPLGLLATLAVMGLAGGAMIKAAASVRAPMRGGGSYSAAIPVFLVLQIGFASLALSLAMASLDQIRDIRKGAETYEASPRVAVAMVDYAGLGLPFLSRSRGQRLVEGMDAAVADVRGIERTAWSTWVPGEPNHSFYRSRRIEVPGLLEGDAGTVAVVESSAGLPSLLGVPLRAGRLGVDEEESDWAVIDTALAQRVWGEPTAALGQRIRLTRRADAGEDPFDFERTVVGVAEAIIDPGNADAAPRVFISSVSAPGPRSYYLMKSNSIIRDEGRELLRNRLEPVPSRVWEGAQVAEVVDLRSIQSRRTSPMLDTSLVATGLALTLSLIAAAGLTAVLALWQERNAGSDAVRAALGIAPRRLFSRVQLLALALGLAGSLAGAAMYRLAAATDDASGLLLRVDAGHLVFASLLSVLLACVSAMPSALRAMRPDMASLLRAG
ncbi:MAG: hypothetical protein MEQ07_08100 [Aquimonas sp.]|nr:hypothetical protein [Aquimonas sp.]